MQSIPVDVVAWMQKVKAKNNGLEYYTIGNVANKKRTLLVTQVRGNGGAVYYCQDHQIMYPIHGSCTGCQNAVVDAASE